MTSSAATRRTAALTLSRVLSDLLSAASIYLQTLSDENSWTADPVRGSANFDLLFKQTAMNRSDDHSDENSTGAPGGGSSNSSFTIGEVWDGSNVANEAEFAESTRSVSFS
jgi:hypothetical protein